MTTPSQAAFESWMENEAKVIGISSVGISLPWHVLFTPRERSTFQRLWTVAEAYGRKQALEEVLKLAEDHRFDLDGSEYHRGWRNASIRLAKLIKELLK